MILIIADVHLGHRLYSAHTQTGITTAEYDTRYALERVYERVIKPDIDMIICAGDFFNTHRPSSENVRWSITWFNRINTLGKPFYIIPGNHDITTYSNSMAFLKALDFENVYFLTDDIYRIVWKGWNIYFVPFFSSTTKDKYSPTYEKLISIMQTLNPTDKNIIITHIQESAAKIGAENFILSKGVSVFELDEYTVQYPFTKFIAGHMHLQQEYKKKNGIHVVYPGSLTYMDFVDCGKLKGYVTMDEEGNIKFAEIDGLRRYIHSVYKTEEELESFLETLPNTVDNICIFLTVPSNLKMSESAIRKIFSEKGYEVSRIQYFTDDKDKVFLHVDNVKSKNPIQLLETWLHAYKDTTDESIDIDKIIERGKGYINAYQSS